MASSWDWYAKRPTYPYACTTPKGLIRDPRFLENTKYGEFLWKRDFWQGQPVERWRFKTAADRDLFCADFGATIY